MDDLLPEPVVVVVAEPAPRFVPAPSSVPLLVATLLEDAAAELVVGASVEDGTVSWSVPGIVDSVVDGEAASRSLRVDPEQAADARARTNTKQACRRVRTPPFSVSRRRSPARS